MAQRGSPHRRSAGQPQPDHRGRRDRFTDRPRREQADWQQFDAFGPDPDEELPPWAGPNAYPASTVRRPGGERGTYAVGQADEEYYDDGADPHWQAAVDLADRPARAGAPGRRGRAAAARLRKSRRRIYRWCGIAIAVCVIAAGVTAIVTHHNPKPSLYVTSLLPGEFKSVPSACGSVSSTVLNQYLPGPGRTVASEIAESTQSQCTFTLDRKPDFLVLEVSAQAYQPFAAATAAGTAAGSASANAQDNYVLTQHTLAKPPKGSPLSAAQISPLPATGQQALVAVQTEHVKRITTDVATVVIRDRNVLIVASESGQESGQGFGPVAVATLRAGAEAAAKGMLAKSVTEPTA